LFILLVIVIKSKFCKRYSSHGIPRDIFKNCLVPWDAMGYFKNFSSHGMGYFSKTFHPMGWDTFQKFFVPWDGIYFKIFHSSHPMGRNLIEKRPMGWDGIIPSHAEPWSPHNGNNNWVSWHKYFLFKKMSGRVGPSKSDLISKPGIKY
jgi:hypothetical protein